MLLEVFLYKHSYSQVHFPWTYVSHTAFSSLSSCDTLTQWFMSEGFCHSSESQHGWYSQPGCFSPELNVSGNLGTWELVSLSLIVFSTPYNWLAIQILALHCCYSRDVGGSSFTLPALGLLLQLQALCPLS